MKTIFISLLIIALFSIFLGTGYFIYKKNHFLTDAQLPEKNSETVSKNKPFSFTFPFVFNAPTTTTSLTTSSQTQLQNTPLNKKQLNLGKDYLTFYQNTVNNLNKILATIGIIQQILVEIGQKYENRDNSALYSSLSKGADENLILVKNISDFKNSLDSWSLANKQIGDKPLQSKTEQVINAGYDFVQSSSEFSEAVGKILSFKGVGNFNELSQQVQNTAQKINDSGKILNQLFNELNSALSS